jgi:prophage regulatory protein
MNSTVDFDFAPYAIGQAAKPVRLLSVREVCAWTGMGRTRIYDLMRVGRFPKPVKLGQSSRWASAEVEAFVAASLAARDSKKPPNT